MTKIANPAKKHKYFVEMDGYDAASCQKVTFGKVEITEAVHGDGNKDEKTPDRVKYPDMVFDKLVAEDLEDNFFWGMLLAASNGDTGQRGLREDYEIHFYVGLLSGQDTVVRKWLCRGWCKGVEDDSVGDKEEGNYMEKATFAINGFSRVI